MEIAFPPLQDIIKRPREGPRPREERVVRGHGSPLRRRSRAAFREDPRSGTARSGPDEDRSRRVTRLLPLARLASPSPPLPLSLVPPRELLSVRLRASREQDLRGPPRPRRVRVTVYRPAAGGIYFDEVTGACHAMTLRRLNLDTSSRTAYQCAASFVTRSPLPPLRFDLPST
jgi:hypothetical protein